MAYWGTLGEIQKTIHSSFVSLCWHLPENCPRLETGDWFCSPSVTVFGLRWHMKLYLNPWAREEGLSIDLVRDKNCCAVSKFIRRSVLLKTDSLDSLVILCDIWRNDNYTIEDTEGINITCEETSTEELSGFPIVKENSVHLDFKVDPTLQKHLRNLLLNADDHDVTIKVQNRAFKAHKCMLRTRSPVFAAMFKHPMKENLDDSVTIDDCEPGAFGEFLSYVYTGMVEDLSIGKAMGLYYLGDKYDFSRLKDMCVDFLKASLSAAVVCDVIDFAKKHGEDGLLDCAIRFFSDNTQAVLVTDEWQRFALSNFTAANELYIKALESIKKSNCE